MSWINMGQPKTQILCVDDDRVSLKMMETLLRKADEDLSVTSVETGAEALALIGETEFDLYVLDVWLPGMDGFELCRRIREQGSTKPIIFFSGMVRPDDRRYGIAAGANEFLVKPNDLDIFTATVKRLLSETL